MEDVEIPVGEGSNSTSEFKRLCRALLPAGVFHAPLPGTCLLGSFLQLPRAGLQAFRTHRLREVPTLPEATQHSTI